MIDDKSRPHYTHLLKKKRTQAFSVSKRRPKRAWIGRPTLPQVTIFTIITSVMRRPLVARGLAILALRKLIANPILFP
jgi:hypothetical protein